MTIFFWLKSSKFYVRIFQKVIFNEENRRWHVQNNIYAWHNVHILIAVNYATSFIHHNLMCFSVVNFVLIFLKHFIFLNLYFPVNVFVKMWIAYGSNALKCDKFMFNALRTCNIHLKWFMSKFCSSIFRSSVLFSSSISLYLYIRFHFFTVSIYACTNRISLR